MTTPIELPPELREGRSDRRETFKLINALRRGLINVSSTGSTEVGSHVEIYVRPDGNDSNDGLTRATALKTGMAAALKTNAAGGGTWHVAAGSWPSETYGAGWWLRGLYDVGGGGPGWILITSAVNIFFESTVGAQFGYQSTPIVPGGGAAAFTDSPFQLCGTTQMVWVDGLQANPGALNVPALRIGLSSPPVTWDAGTVYAAGICVRYAGLAYTSRVAGNIGNQPNLSPAQWYRMRQGIDDGLGASLTAVTSWTKYQLFGCSVATCPTVESGYQFLSNWEDGHIIRFGAVDPDDPNCAGFRMFCEGADLASNVATYYQTFRHNMMQGGGFWSTGANVLLMFEGRNSGEDMVTAVFTAEAGNGGGTQAEIFGEMTGADSVAPALSTKRNTGGFVTIFGATGTIDGPVYYSNQPVASYVTSGSGSVGQFGTVLNHSNLQTDEVLRGAPVTCPYKNLAPDISISATGTPVPDYWGIANRGRHNTFVYLFHPATAPQAVGDRFAWGAMVRFVDNDPADNNCPLINLGGPGTVATFLTGGSCIRSGQIVTLNDGESISWFPAITYNRYQWRWIWGMLRIDALTGVGGISCLIGPTGASVSDTWCIRVPAADQLSDAQVATMAMTHAPWPNATNGVGALVQPTIGNSALRPGQKDARWDPTALVWRDIGYDNGMLTGVSATPGGSAGGDLTGTYPNPSLVNWGSAGTYGNSTQYVAQVVTEAKGRVSSVTAYNLPHTWTGLYYASLSGGAINTASLMWAGGVWAGSIGTAYMSGYARSSAVIELDITVNSLTGGLGNWNVSLYQSGSLLGTITVASGTTGRVSSGVIPLTGIVGDNFGLQFDGTGVTTPAGSAITFSAALILEGS